MIPTSYYGTRSPIGRMINHLQNKRAQLKIGVVGLGVGTLASYGRASDQFRFYEINPAVVEIARRKFQYLSQTPAGSDIVLGDARLSLTNEDSQHFDLLVIDAFSGDAIPTHLLSIEAMAIYQRHLDDSGVLAIHVSNTHLDLGPVVSALAEATGLEFCILENMIEPGSTSAETPSVWLLASVDGLLIASAMDFGFEISATDKRVLWTDNFSNLFTILKAFN